MHASAPLREGVDLLLCINPLVPFHVRGVAEGGLAKEAVDGPARLLRVVADEHALAEGEPVGLDRDATLEAVGEGLGLPVIGEYAERSRGDPRIRHQLLGERLAALDLAGGAVGPLISDRAFNVVGARQGSRRSRNPGRRWCHLGGHGWCSDRRGRASA